MPPSGLHWEWSISLGNILTIISFVVVIARSFIKVENAAERINFCYKAIYNMQYFLEKQYPTFVPVQERE